MEDQYDHWRVETPQTYPAFRSTWRGRVTPSSRAQHGLFPFSKLPHDLAVAGQWISLPDSLKSLAFLGYPVSPIIAQCNTWAVTEYGVESLLSPRAYFFDWKRLGEDWQTHLRGKRWYDACWAEIHEVLFIARALAPHMLPTTQRQPPQPPGKKLRPSRRLHILQRDGFRCQLCGVSATDGEHVRLEIDHRTPRKHGGTNDLENVWVLCQACNRGKGTQLLS